MYEAVHAHPDGDSTAARFAATAARQGYDGVVVRADDARPEYGELDGADCDVVDGVEIVADGPEQASGAVGNFRPDRTVVLVRGGTDRLNRFAVEQDRVDVLSRPFAGDVDGRGPSGHQTRSGDGDVNHVLAKAAKRNGVRIEFDLGPALRATGGHRVRHLDDLRKLKRILDHYDAPYVVSANARSHLELRAPRELAAVGEEIGLGAEWVREGLAEWKRIAARNRERLSESFIAPGVERGRYEEDD
ncbi:RNase P subunit p30 family protein [Halogeometricum luteum]|uniref:Ribonuclease P protein component 3 n=1 Tax=Halogeometricum luteum TaxID=2950537 RepID=A0ABU2FXV4_9EURY|nr:RNase P subunit p30 family protein [Halogeometricum sp. S3BR5-2]MDS0293365.1 ribonuclease P [Halogeometricum sp. S3BR5-2]